MKHQVTRVSILQTAKVAAAVYAGFGLLLMPVGCFFLLQANNFSGSSNSGLIYFLAPILYGLFGFIFTALGCWLYNTLVPYVGGIEIELDDRSSPPPTA